MSGSISGIWKEGDAFASLVADVVRGEFLVESRYDDWSAGPRRRVHEQLRAALLPAALDAARNPSQRCVLAQAVVAIDPFDEAGVAALAKAFLDAGRRTAARGLLRDFARRLREDFDEEPSPNWLAEAGLAGIKI